MVIAPDLIDGICEIAKLPPRQREILHLMAQDKEPADIAEALGIALKTVYTHIRRAKIAIAAHQQEVTVMEEARGEGFDSPRRFYAFLLHECLKGPPQDNPRTPKYRVVIPAYGKLPPQGEVVRIGAGPPLTVDDLVTGDFEVKLPRG